MLQKVEGGDGFGLWRLNFLKVLVTLRSRQAAAAARTKWGKAGLALEAGFMVAMGCYEPRPLWTSPLTVFLCFIRTDVAQAGV